MFLEDNRANKLQKFNTKVNYEMTVATWAPGLIKIEFD